MSEQVSFGRLSAGGSGGAGEGPFKVLLMADFSGRGAAGPAGASLTRRRGRKVDVDNYEQVLAALGAEVHVPVGGPGGSAITIRPKELDDLHPDQLFAGLEIFAALRDLRSRLSDGSTFEQAAEEVRSWAAGRAEGGGKEADGDMLGRLLGQRPADVDRAPAPAAAGGGAARIDALLRDVIGPYIVPDIDKEQSALLGRVDEAIAGQMRAILHDPGFQAVEAAWRSLHFLVTSLEIDEDLQLYLMDATKADLAADMMAGEDLASTWLHTLLYSETVGTAGGEPWAAVVGGLAFDRTAADAAVLGRVAKIAQAAGTPFVAGALDRVAGCASLARTPDPKDWTGQAAGDDAAAWDELRKLPEAHWLALALPRLLLRLPYGRQSEPVDGFEFEELGEGVAHEGCLWGSGAMAVAQALGAGFTEHGWQMASQLYRDVEDLPMYVYTADGEKRVLPCAEVYLTDRAGEALQAMGLTALLSVRGRDAVRVRGVASLADPVTALAGRWSG